MKFNVRLKQLRQRNRLTQSELAQMLNLKPTAISNYESCTNEPSLEKLVSLAKYFDVSCDYLLGLTEAYLPIGGEVLDKDIVEFFNNYQKLSPESLALLHEYIEFLIYRQEKR